MIRLSYQGQQINRGIPIRRQPIIYTHNIFAIDLDSHGVASAFEIGLMEKFKILAEGRRRVLDGDAYPGSSAGYRFSRGNSCIETETYLGKTVRLTLTYANTDNPDNGQGPSAFTTTRIAELAQTMRRIAPNLVLFDDALEAISDTSTLPPLPRPCSRPVAALFVFAPQAVRL